MAMTVNPDAGLSAPQTFREEGIYAFRFYLDGDAKGDVSFKIRFESPFHQSGDERHHSQHFVDYHGRGEAARRGSEGSLLISGVNNEVVEAAPSKLWLPTAKFAGRATTLREGLIMKLVGVFRITTSPKGV